jgi:hypothetical protein
MGARSKPKGSLVLGLAAIGVASACGGQTETKGDGGAQEDAAVSVGFSDAAQFTETGSLVIGSPDSATTGPMPTVDAAPPTAGDGAPTACTPMGAAGGGGNGECTSSFGETCGGTNYQASCSCPRGSCVCFGLSTTVVSFTGCPSCPGLAPGSTTDDLLALCGFPH